tara:strand:- start:494 stop:673 length:180 start_codon:yes stop_codon:yes gene_type:complete
MIVKGKKTAMPQIVLLFSQLLFLTVLIGGFSFISRASFTTYVRSLSPLTVDGAVSSLYE